jgi:ribosomal protein L37AE/L43A
MKKVTEHAQGQWPRILSALAGLSPDQLTDKHQPCPLCGGKDRYRFDDKDGNGSWFCNKCGGKNESGGAGNGMELLMRRKSWDYQTAATEVERFLGVSIEKPKSQAKPKPPISRAELHWWYSENFVVARFPGKQYRPFVFDGTRWSAGVPNPPRPLLMVIRLQSPRQNQLQRPGRTQGHPVA